jgi:hypothetical protein
MKRTYWIFGACLSLLLVGGLVLDVSAQQQTPPPAAAPSAPSTPDSSTSPSTSPSLPSPPTPPLGTMQRDNPSATTPPSSNTQIETRETERIRVVERDGARLFGIAPTLALLIGAGLLVVIVVGLVAMSRRSDEVTHTHRV